MSWRIGWRSWFQFLGAGPVISILALVPSFFYLDHWADYLHGSLGHEEAAADEAEGVEHAAHCHFGPATCSDQPVPPNMRSFFTFIEVLMPGYKATAIDDSASAPEEHVALIPTEPPRV